MASQSLYGTSCFREDPQSEAERLAEMYGLSLSYDHSTDKWLLSGQAFDTIEDVESHLINIMHA